jgi:hypothetical protein
VRAFWQPRSHDFNVFTERKHVEKPSSVNKRYVHRNPVKRGLVTSPELCRWSSFRDYRLGEEGPVKIGAPSIPPFAAQRVGAGGPANLPVFVFPFETTGAPLFA